MNMKVMTYGGAINEALREALQKDENVYLIGEDIGVYGGCYGVTTGLVEEFGEDRVMDTPISEQAICGAAVGSAMQGKRPVVEIMYADFLTVASDLIINQACRMRYILGKDVKVPVVFRTAYGGGGRYSFNHSQSPEANFLNAPGLTVMMPSTPYDAKGLMASAIKYNNPVLFFEQKYLYKTLKGEVPEEYYEIPIGKGDIKRSGTDITIVATGWMVHKCLEAAKLLEKENISVEVIDPRTLKPLDAELILSSAKKTGRLLVVHEASKTYGFGAEVCAMASEKLFGILKKPARRIAAPDFIIPFSPNLEDMFYPSEDTIVKAVRELTA